MVKALQALVFYGLVMLSAWLPASSYAVDMVTQYRFDYRQGWQSSVAAACTGFITYVTADNAPVFYANNAVFVAPSSCKYDLRNVSTNALYSQPTIGPAATRSVCPDGYQASGGSCVLIVVDPNIAKCAAAKDGSDMITGFSSFPGFGSAFCPSDGGGASCGSKIDGGFAIVKNGVKTWTYEIKYTGAVCTPPAAGTGTPGKQTDCKGTVGTVNGITVCSPPSDRNTIEAAKSTTTTNPVASGQAAGSAGSTTSDTSSSCTGSKCAVTTTTTTTPAGGGTPTVTTKTEDIPKEDFCKDNPRSMACKEFNFGDISPDVVGSKTVNLGITKAADFGPATGVCPAPKTVTVMGITLSMPFTLLCDFARAINPLLIGFAWLSATLTFFGFARK